MTYQLKVEQKPTFLHAIITGQNSKENVLRYLEEVVQKCEACHCRRVLIEEHLEGPRLKMMDIFNIVVEGSNKSRWKIDVIAYVDLNNQSDSMKFAETLAVNRGFTVSVFSNVADAEKWLLEKSR